MATLRSAAPRRSAPADLVEGRWDSTLRLRRRGYRFVSEECERLGVDAFRTRFGLRRVICLRGTEAVLLFYGPTPLTRRGAMPRSVVSLLQDDDSVQALDGAEHEHRKQLFLDVCSGRRADALLDAVRAAWRVAEGRWVSSGQPVRLHDELATVLTLAAMRWVGVADPDRAASQWRAALADMIERSGSVGPVNWWARRARRRCERWARGQIRAARRGDARPDTPLMRVASYRDERGGELPVGVAAIEMINLLRPVVAVERFLVFGAVALREHSDQTAALLADDTAAAAFVTEVRRTAPFFPMIAARTLQPLRWHGVRLAAGTHLLLDLYGTDHDKSTWPDADQFRPGRFLPHPDVVPAAFAPQGSGDPRTTHHCPGEPVTAAIMSWALRRLARLDLEFPDQDLSVDLGHMPALPRSGVIVRCRRPGEPSAHEPGN